LTQTVGSNSPIRVTLRTTRKENLKTRIKRNRRKEVANLPKVEINSSPVTESQRTKRKKSQNNRGTGRSSKNTTKHVRRRVQRFNNPLNQPAVKLKNYAIAGKIESDSRSRETATAHHQSVKTKKGRANVLQGGRKGNRGRKKAKQKQKFALSYTSYY